MTSQPARSAYRFTLDERQWLRTWVEGLFRSCPMGRSLVEDPNEGRFVIFRADGATAAQYVNRAKDGCTLSSRLEPLHRSGERGHCPQCFEKGAVQCVTGDCCAGRRLALGDGVLAPAPAFAYVGPGVAAGAVAVTLGVLGSIVTGILGVIYYPIKRLFKKLKKAPKRARGEAERASDRRRWCSLPPVQYVASEFSSACH